MRCSVIPGGQIDAGRSQKHFLSFRVLLNVKIDPNFRQKRFLCFIHREILIPGEKKFTLATLSAISCNIRSN